LWLAAKVDIIPIVIGCQGGGMKDVEWQIQKIILDKTAHV
jgi:hypothetical protein